MQSREDFHFLPTHACMCVCSLSDPSCLLQCLVSFSFFFYGCDSVWLNIMKLRGGGCLWSFLH